MLAFGDVGMTGRREIRWARRIRCDVVALWLAKAVCAVIAAYALSPIGLIPDFIPVLGYLDEVILLPLAILLAVRLVRPAPMAEFHAAAAEREGRPVSRAGLVAMAAIWLPSRHGSSFLTSKPPTSGAPCPTGP